MVVKGKWQGRAAASAREKKGEQGSLTGGLHPSATRGEGKRVAGWAVVLGKLRLSGPRVGLGKAG